MFTAFKIEGDTLTMTRVSDGCGGRGGPDGVMTMQRGGGVPKLATEDSPIGPLLARTP